MEQFSLSQVVGPEVMVRNDQKYPAGGGVRTPSEAFQQVVNNENYLSRSPDSLRKGKWTAEEERYANKVIEHFNAGMLKLDEGERGITLRAYLSQKLGCDPMRITKKYTGASCLGKRVYHAYRQSGKVEDVENAMVELNMLEDEFRLKLNQTSRKRGSSGSYVDGHSITTPAIDALFKHPSSSSWGGMPANRSISSGYQYSVPSYSHDYGTSMPDDHPQQWAQQGGTSLPALPGGHAFGNLSSNTGFFHRPSVADTSSSSAAQQPSEPPHQTGLAMLSQSVRDSNAFGGDSYGGSYGAAIPLSGASSGGPPQARVVRSSSAGSNTDPRERSSYGYPLAASSGTTNTSNAHAGSTAGMGGTQQDDGSTDAMDPHKKVKITEHDTEAASSLLGFFTHLERNTSQEDMLHFLDGVQRNVIASTVTAARSPPKPSNSPGSGNGGVCLSMNSAAFGPSSMLPAAAFTGSSAH